MFDTDLLADPTTKLSPATVLDAAKDRIQVQPREGDAVWAHTALAFPYRPIAGDIVLLIQQDEAYVIGVLRGRGPTVFESPADLHIAAGGRVHISSKRGMVLDAPEIDVRASRLRVVAERVTESFGEAVRRVAKTFRFRAGRVHSRVDGQYDLKAKRVSTRAEDDVRIDAGNNIHLG